MEFLNHYAAFLLQIITVVAAILVLFLGIIVIAGKNKTKEKGKLIIEKLNELYDETEDKIKEVVLSKNEYKAFKKQQKAATKKDKQELDNKPRLFVINFKGDIKASAVTNLREEVTSILLTAKPNDEVLVRLESSGGMVHAYGLAASQLVRLTEAGLKLTVAVDKVAASGGYMMACVAQQIIAAPFAIIGSIGVIAQLPNFYRFLHKHNIDFEQLTAGEFKRTLTVFGENTKKGRDKLQEEIEDTHDLFKQFIQSHRRQIDISQIATGEHWYGTRAQELQLVDELKTSDDFLMEAKDKFSLYEVKYKVKKALGQRLLAPANQLMQQLMQRTSGQDYL